MTGQPYTVRCGAAAFTQSLVHSGALHQTAGQQEKRLPVCPQQLGLGLLPAVMQDGATGDRPRVLQVPCVSLEPGDKGIY